MNQEALYTLAISYSRGLGAIHTKKLIDYFGTAEQAWHRSAKGSTFIKGFGKKTIADIGSARNLELAKREIEFTYQNQIQFATYQSRDYPKKLRECIDSPPILFWKGNFHFEENHFLAIVGTRKMTAYGKGFIQELIKGLADYPITIVSGLALGCDIHAHREAIKHKLPTIGVLAHGLNKIYPKANEKEGIQMQENGGLVSEFSTFHKPEAINFIRRNRIIAGLSEMVLIVESDYKGGAMSTAKFANHYNREVMALPGRVNDQYSKGPNHLVATNQSYMIRNTQDLLYHFNLEKQSKPKQRELFVELDQKEKKVYEFLQRNGKKQIDQISLKLNLSSYEIMPTLLNLELKNIIRPLPGKFFECI